MASREVLTIVQARDQRSDRLSDDVVVLNELIESASTEQLDSHRETLSVVDLDPIAELPLFRMLWVRFATAKMLGQVIKLTGLPSIVVVYRQLESIVRERDVQVIDCVGIHDYYSSAIADLARNEDIELKGDVKEKKPRLRGFLSGLVGYLYVVGESIVFAILRLLRGDREETDLVFVPHLNRFGSMEPVIYAADYDSRVVLPVTAFEWYRSTASGRWTAARAYDPIPITRFATFSILVSQVLALGRLCSEVLVDKTIKKRLQQVVAEEFDVRLDTAIDYSLGKIYDTNFSSIPNLFLAQQMICDTGCQGLAIGALSLRQQAFLVASEEAGIETYHIPHTVPLHHECIPQPETAHIVPGPISKTYLQESDYIPNGEQVVPIGRPLLERLRNDRPETDDSTDSTSVVIATQPFPDDIRSAFVTDVIEALPDGISVIIKPHPNEDTAFYESLISGTEANVTVVGSDTESHLKRADLTFVINTNVGIESVAVGTPTVSVNYWEPRTFVRPYAQYGPIPVMRTQGELVEFLSSLDEDTIRELRDEQVSYMDEEYQPNENVAQRINKYISPISS